MYQSLSPVIRRFGTTTALLGQQQNAIPFSEIPGPKPLPLIGNIWRYLPLVGDYKIDQLYQNAQLNRQRYGPIVREQITRNHSILHLFDPNDIETFFRADGKEPHRRSHRALLKYRRERPELYNDGGLFPENGPNWSRLRKLFQHYLMKKSEVARRASILDEITTDCLSKLGDHQNFERFLYHWSIKSSLAVFLDYNHDNMPSDQVIQSLIESLHHTLEAIDGTEIKSEKWVKQPAKCPFFKKLAEAEGTMHAFVARRLDHLIRSNSMRPEISFVRDWLCYDRLDRKDVATFILDCILASLHTTAYTTTFLLNHIAGWEPVKRDKLRLEVMSRMPAVDRKLATDIFDSMPLLKDCLKETLRLKPVSVGTGRLTQSEMVIRNYLIPKGVMVIAHNQTICLDESVYEQPGAYLPERWAEYRKRARSERPSAFAWLPFGFGPRVCIGQRLITLQIYIFAARLLQQFDFEIVGEIKTSSMLVHTLDGNVRMKTARL